MKKPVIFVVALILAAGLASAQTVTVTKPAAGDTWIKGQSYAITWTKSGSMPNTVRISLRDAATLAEVALIQDNVPNGGSYLWTIPASTADGSYKVRVKVKNSTVQGDSGTFAIAASAPPTGSITVTKPAAGDAWQQTTAYTITWTKSGTMPNTVKIDLVNAAATTIVKPIVDGAPNGGSYGWTVPADVAPGSYHVRVAVKTTAITDDSDLFSVSAPQAASITVTKPAAGDTWHKAKGYDITWTNTGSVPGPIKVDLMDSAGTTVVKPIVYSMSNNTGTINWTIPADTPFGDYRIRVATLGPPQVQGESGVFHIAVMAIAGLSRATATAALSIKHDIAPIITNWWGVRQSTAGLPSSSFVGRAGCIPPNVDPNLHSDVGYDYYNFPWNGFNHYLTLCHRSRIVFPMGQYADQVSKLISAKIHFTQTSHMATNDNNASCGTGLFLLLAPWTDWANPSITLVCGLEFLSTDYTVDVTDAARKWLNGSVANNGLLMVSQEIDWGTPPKLCISCFDSKLTLEFQNK